MLKTITIATGANLSGALDMEDQSGLKRLVGIRVPFGWTAADLTFQAAPDGVAFSNIFDDLALEIKVVVGAVPAGGKLLSLTEDVAVPLGKWRHVKVRSGTSAVPVDQAADRILEFYLT